MDSNHVKLSWWLAIPGGVLVVAISLWAGSALLNEEGGREIGGGGAASSVSNAPSEMSEAGTDESLARERVLALLNSKEAGTRSIAYNEMFPDWVRRDPYAAAEFLDKDEASRWRKELMVVLAQTWTDMDVDEAEAWASDLEHPTERNLALGYVAFRAADKDPVRAVKVLENGRMSTDRKEVIVENLAQQWAAKDLTPLADWIGSLPAGEERDGYFARLANSQAQSDPVTAARIVSERIPPGAAQTEAALDVLGQWAWNDITGAVAWVNQFPRGELYDLAWTEIAEIHAKKQGRVESSR